MVHILGPKRRLDSFDPHGLEFQQRQGPCGILQKSMIDPDGDLPAGDQLAFNQVGFQNLMGEAFGHLFPQAPSVLPSFPPIPPANRG